VLRAAGRRVAIARAPGDARPLCCGRTLMTAGLVDEAKREAKRVVDALAPHVANGASVVGLEPSCLLSLRDEFLALGLGASVAKLAERAMLVPEYLMREHAAGRLTLPLHPLPQKRAIVHGHCHQKAVVGMGDEIALLGAMGLDFDLLDSGCCGMAGSFGFDRDKVQLSMRIGEMVLLPEVRAAEKDTLVITNGYSCREQIAQGAQRQALHLAEVLDLAIQRHGSGHPRMHHVERALPDAEIE